MSKHLSTLIEEAGQSVIDIQVTLNHCDMAIATSPLFTAEQKQAILNAYAPAKEATRKASAAFVVDSAA